MKDVPMTPAIEMKGITKFFASTQVRANEGVDFSVERGEVHALVGENGAGKTTLMNILYGLIKPDSGEIFMDSQNVRINHPDDAIKHGIGMVHQHFKLVPSFTVAENILLGMEPNQTGFLSQQKENKLVDELAKKFNLPVDPTARIRDLPVSMQQRVEILKVLQRNAKILILDEPTAVLTPQEVHELITVIRGLSKQGYTIIFITHKLIEVMSVADRVSVMRGGRMMGTKKVSETSIPELARMMVGRDVQFQPDRPQVEPGELLLLLRNLCAQNDQGLPALKNVSLEVREGEILGIAGVSGNGQRELAEVIAGLRTATSGDVEIAGKPILKASVAERMRAGLAFIPEERMRHGTIGTFSVAENVILQRHGGEPFSHGIFLNFRAIAQYTDELIHRFNVKTPTQETAIKNLSGGNIQKLILARELSRRPKVLIAAQPTRGVDIGATEYIRNVLIEQRSQQVATLLISEDLDEILALSDRIAVLYEGEVVGIVKRDEADVETLGLMMAGVRETA